MRQVPEKQARDSGPCGKECGQKSQVPARVSTQSPLSLENKKHPTPREELCS